MKSLVPESSNAPAEVPSALAVTQSSSVSMASIASEGSKSSAISNSSHRGNSMVPGVTSTGDNLGAAGDSESSHLEERVLRGLHELESRCRFVTNYCAVGKSFHCLSVLQFIVLIL